MLNQVADKAQLKDAIQTTRITERMLHDSNKSWKGEFRLTKYDFSALKGVELEQAEKDHATLSPAAMKDKYGDLLISDENIGENILLNAGINALTTLLAGGGGTAYNNANARVGVGDSSTAAVASQTALQASTNKTFQAMDASYPTYGASQQIVFRATFGSAAANYSWQEFIVDNGSGSATALNRLVSNQGTKVSGQSWQVTVTITLS